MEILLQATSYKDAGRTRKSKAEGRTFVVVVVQSLSHVWFFATAWTVARQSLLSMGFFRQEYWSGLPFPHPGDLPYPGIALASPASSCIGRFLTIWATWEAPWVERRTGGPSCGPRPRPPVGGKRHTPGGCSGLWGLRGGAAAVGNGARPAGEEWRSPELTPPPRSRGELPALKAKGVSGLCSPATPEMTWIN